MVLSVMKRKTFFLFALFFHPLLITMTSSFGADIKINNVHHGELIPREEILNHALNSAEKALAHIKDDWIPLFDENAILDDPTGSHAFKGKLIN